MQLDFFENCLFFLGYYNKLGINYYDNHIGKVDYAYNNTQGLGWDMLESLSQKIGINEYIDKMSISSWTINNYEMNVMCVNQL